MSGSGTSSTARLDKWLWAIRLFRSRSLAADACRAGSVTINEVRAKPAREVRVGELIAVRQGLIVRTVRVIGVPRTRVGAGQVGAYRADLTPTTEYAKAREHRVQQFLSRGKGSGRPTKRDRRLIGRLLP